LLQSDYTYVAFDANIEQFNIRNPQTQYKNTYSYQKLDTNLEREIILTLTEDIKTENFYLDFSHSSRLYTPSFYISENNQ